MSRLMGFEQAKLFPPVVWYGCKDEGKMSSRAGNSFTFFQLKTLVEDALKENLTKYEGKWTQEEIDKTAYLLAGIKYGAFYGSCKEIV